ncbi:hypothetical protein [Bdellovibrio bacteriovorus]|uniref:hypothetical protein n=1 Tax=Bdellovibrio bacteriovorus TaxID=959 RepID=UPI0035A64068
MKTFILGLFITAGLLSGCSDVTPQVTMLRSKTPAAGDSTLRTSLRVENAVASTAQTAEGYQLEISVSKEDTGKPRRSAGGYSLILNPHVQ